MAWNLPQVHRYLDQLAARLKESDIRLEDSREQWLAKIKEWLADVTDSSGGMSTLVQHQRHLGALHDIRDIMAALKNISLTESQRLRRFLASQQRVMDGIEQAMGDFLGHYPQSLPGGDAAMDIVLLIGSERGFCGDFNETLLEELNTRPAPHNRTWSPSARSSALNWMNCQIHAETLAGLSTVEDVPEVLLAVVDKLRELSARHGSMQLTIVHHHYDGRRWKYAAANPSAISLPPRPAAAIRPCSMSRRTFSFHNCWITICSPYCTVSCTVRWRRNINNACSTCKGRSSISTGNAPS